MGDHHALKDSRDRLAAEILENHCLPCEDKRGPIDVDDPLACGCCCSKVLPGLKRLAQLDQALSLTGTELTLSPEFVLAEDLAD